MKGKTIFTNTATLADVELLADRGVEYLITTTPEFEGRSFGTNVMEAVLVAIAEKPIEAITAQDYHYLLDLADFRPRIERLAKTESA